MKKSDPKPRILKAIARLAVLLLSSAPGLALAQITSPVQLPTLPGLPGEELGRTVDGALHPAQSRMRELREARLLRIRSLLRANPQTLEADPRGAPMIRSEVVALSPTDDALQRARAAGFAVGRTRALDGLGLTMVVLEAPPGMSTRRALSWLREADPAGVYDFNHVYSGSGSIGGEAGAKVHRASNPAPAPGLRVGLIDAGVQPGHAAFQGVQVHQRGCAGGAVASAHGTAVASLILGSAGDATAPGAQLYAADVYCGLPTGGAIDAIADAFAWLSRERVPVINISLVGPPNDLLGRIVRVVSARGHILVAAVGNDGPSAPALYPAAYPEVVAVTGVDRRRRALLEACRGAHVNLAAPGADIAAASPDAAAVMVRGTSFAAPIVAGLLARELQEPDPTRARAALAALIARAVDLGPRGRDNVYGDGLVGETMFEKRMAGGE